MKIFGKLSLISTSFYLALGFSSLPAQESKDPIWAYKSAPISIGKQLLNSKNIAEIPINRATSYPIRSIIGTDVNGLDGTKFNNEFSFKQTGPVLSISKSGSAKSDSPILFTFNAVTIEGKEEVSFFIKNEYRFDKTFTFPLQEKMPDKVSVAGEFNGWNQESNVMTVQSDGSLSVTMSLKPGRYTYKYVIDGDWVADPTNPDTDGSGFNNSVLRVTDPNPEAPSLHFISSRERGSGTHGGVKSNQPIKDITAILNNQVIDDKYFSISKDKQHVAFNLETLETFGEDILSIAVETESGAYVIEDYLLMMKDTDRTPRDEIIYFVMTDRFLDGNSENNPAPPEDDLHPSAQYKGGDWQGVRQKLREKYFSNLGATTLWLSPVTENTMKAETDALPPHRKFTSYHGYWPTSFTKTNPAFGTMDDLRGVVSDAHDKDIAVVFDFVANHVHEDHPLIQSQPDLATELDLGNQKLNIREFDSHPLTTWFDKFLPTLDYVNNPDARKVAVDAAMYWMAETNADGFRHDATKHIAIPFWQELTEEINDVSRSTGKRYYQVGETIGSRETIMLNTGTDQLDGQFDFPLLFSITPALARGNSSLANVADAIIESWDTYPRSAIMSPLVGNHDVSRFMANAEPDDLPEGSDEKEVGYENPPKVDDPISYTKMEAALALLMAMPGAPMIYYGDEVGMTGAHDPDNRRPFPWDNLSTEQKELRQTVAELTKLRHKSVAMRRGNVSLIAKDENYLIIERTSPEQSVAFILATGNADETKTAMNVQDLINSHFKDEKTKTVFKSDDQKKRHFRYAYVELNP